MALSLTVTDPDSSDQETPTAPVSAIVTAYQRIDLALLTISKLRACRPRPAEILVHVDANQMPCEKAIRQAFPDVLIVCSDSCIGPGGGRNKLLAVVRHELVASFDDDSYPIDKDYFRRAVGLFEQFPNATILCAAVYHQGEVVAPDVQAAEWVSDFSGGACIYRRSGFMATGGYVPLPIAYGMEEVDLALRLHAQGGKILKSSWLRVFHDTDLQHHTSPEVTAASIANQALLAYLRYPPSLWLVGLGQCCKRVLWLLRHGRRRGILSGLLMTPVHLRTHRRYRQPIRSAAVKSYLALRHAPRSA